MSLEKLAYERLISVKKTFADAPSVERFDFTAGQEKFGGLRDEFYIYDVKQSLLLPQAHPLPDYDDDAFE
ncbi:hypothetical protein QVD17_28028 [Tagetes erecta]|uniref:Uncharacterized protein n=1 Tax=Tagetes erecta TaxID=13708 RepID=A0AAD8NRQ2_TARER|nr:hypothetical protein QVD17_28028 [Tagetes erecta]